MNQFNEYGYSKVRDYVKTFAHVGINNGATQIKRVQVSDITITGQVLTYNITFDNVDGSLTGKTVNEGHIYEDASNTNAVASVQFTDFTFESEQDTLTLTIKIQVPQL